MTRDSLFSVYLTYLFRLIPCTESYGEEKEGLCGV